jgi:hypothetical protein
MECPKCWWKSRTLWFNAACSALIALEAATGILQPHVPVNVYLVMAVVLPVVNAMLRVITTQAIALKGGQ